LAIANSCLDEHVSEEHAALSGVLRPLTLASADQAERDHASFVQAIREGRIDVEIEH